MNKKKNKIIFIIDIIALVFILFCLSILLFQYYYGCYNMSCVYICSEDVNWIIRFLFRCA